MPAALSSLLSRITAQRWLWWLGVFIWGAVLFALSSRSRLPTGPEIPYQDKVIHFLYFSGGGFCFALALFVSQVPVRGRWLWLAAGAVFGGIIGALDEYHQTFTPGRSGNDLGDWLADFTGASAGGLLAWFFLTWIRRQAAMKTPA